MRNNPFITIILLILIEITLYNYIDYTNLILPSSEYADLVFPVLCFLVPVVAILISFSVNDLSNDKKFRHFSIFLLIAAIITFVVYSFLMALAGAYQH